MLGTRGMRQRALSGAALSGAAAKGPARGLPCCCTVIFRCLPASHSGWHLGPLTALASTWATWAHSGHPPGLPPPPCPPCRAPDHQLPEEEVRSYASEILLALQYLHLQGFIYR